MISFSGFILIPFFFFSHNHNSLMSLLQNIPVQHRELTLKRGKYSVHA